MKKSLSSIAVGAFITLISLLLLALAYPHLLVLFGLLFVTACVILGLSLIAAIPKRLELAYLSIGECENLKKEVARCKYCGSGLTANSYRCPNCGAPTRTVKS